MISSTAIKNDNGSQIIFDICLTIGSVKNIADTWSPKFSFNIYLQMSDSDNYPCPYQIMQSDKILESNIDLRCYQSGQLVLSSMQEKIIKQTCIFRAGLSINSMEEKQLSCLIEYFVQQQLIGTAMYEYNSCLSLCNYVPIYSPSLGIIINAKIQSQVLGIRAYKNCSQDSTSILYKTLDWIFDQNNRLTHKLKIIENLKQQSKTFSSISNIIPIESHQSSINQSNQFYKQYAKLKQFKESRIFRKKSSDLHRQQISNFIIKIRGQYTNNLQLNWQKYLKLSFSQCLIFIEDLRNKFVEHFAYQISHKIIRNNGLQKQDSCLLTVDQIKIKMNGFQLLDHTQNTQIKKFQKYQQSNILSSVGKHIIVLMHGFGASSYGMSLIQRTIMFLYPHIIILNARSNQIIESDFNIQMMGRNLAVQIQQFLNSMDIIDQTEISFIGHSLGGLIIRAALTHLEVFKLKMSTFISLSTPHLGHIEHSNKLAKFGMIAINTIQQSNVIDQLLLKDCNDQKNSYLYSLSTHSGLSWFKKIILYGSENDGYVSCNSALIQQINNSKPIYLQMAKNLNQITKNSKICKYEIKFKHEKKGYGLDFSQMLIGRSSHLAFPSNQSFINFFLLQNYKLFKSENRSALEDSY